jgi:eukaryotic-like serine/threonine-protein kinase
MGLSSGARLGPYEIVSPLGAGGMGEVYRANDTRLDRTVAIKVLPEHLSFDAQCRDRFQREAKTISGFSHPHICALYDVGEQDDTRFLVLEYIEGESLADRLRKGPLPITEALKIGAEIASALDAAHRHGIIHRDLKPANVMLTKSGAKLLDFGLAKPAVAATAAAASANAATMAKSLTEQGTIVGTFQYMAPEQLEGAEADARSDIFALGTILYEMTTGKPAFAGKSRVSLIASILSSEPQPMSQAAPMSPPALDHLVRICLAKDPEQRFQSAHDLLLQLRWVGEAGSQIGAAPVIARRHKLRFRAAWALAATSTAALLMIAAAWLFRPAPASLPAVRAYLQPAKGSGFGPLQIAVSPDGAKLVFRQVGVPVPRLFIQSLASGVAQPISDSPKAQWPAFSADSKYVSFCDDTKLQKYDIAGGQVVTIADGVGCAGGSWNQQGTIIFGSPKGLMQVEAGGGSAQVAIPANDKTSFLAPAFLPDGRHFLMAVRTAAADGSGPPDNAIGVGDLKTHSFKILLRTGTGIGLTSTPIPRYSEGFLVYTSQGNLMARPFDVAKLQFTGDSVALGPLEGFFAVSPAGVLAYFAPGQGNKTEIRWLGRSGQQLGRIATSQQYDNPRLSPDGQRIAYQVFTPNESVQGTIWIYDVKRDVSSRVTFDNSVTDDRPIWSPDGKELLFTRYSDTSIHKILSSGLGGQEVLLEKAYPDDWSSDGRYIAYDTGTPVQIGILQLAPEKKTSLLINAKTPNHDARFSADAKFIAYTSEESGQSEIYVVPFPSPTQKWRVSSEGGTRATWRRDGKELFYVSPDHKLMSVAVTRSGDDLSFGKPVVLFQTPFQLTANNAGRPFDVTPDGQRFVVNAEVEVAPQPMTIVSNWTSLLKK